MCNEPVLRRSLAQSFMYQTQAELLEDGESVQNGAKASVNIPHDIQGLVTGLPDHIVRKIVMSYNGMTPMERFLVETCKIKEKISEIEGCSTTSSCGATVGSLGEATRFDEP